MAFLNLQMKDLWRHRKRGMFKIALKIRTTISGISKEFSWIQKQVRLDWKKQLLANPWLETPVHSSLCTPRPETREISQLENHLEISVHLDATLWVCRGGLPPIKEVNSSFNYQDAPALIKETETVQEILEKTRCVVLNSERCNLHKYVIVDVGWSWKSRGSNVCLGWHGGRLGGSVG